jgi:RNA polymerase sigma-70 factor (ECF subfamily)
VHAALPERPEVIQLEAIYRAHRGSVARWAARLGGPGIDPEDVVHEVFLVAAKKLGEFRGEARISTWLYQITLRVVHQERRRQGRSDDRGEPPRIEPSPLEILVQREEDAAIEAVLARLGERYRRVLILHEVEGLSGPEISAQLGVPPSTVWVQLHRARRKLRALLGEAQRAPKRWLSLLLGGLFAGTSATAAGALVLLLSPPVDAPTPTPPAPEIRAESPRSRPRPALEPAAPEEERKPVKKLILLAALVQPTAAAAQDDPPPPPEVVYPRRSVIEFSELRLTGEVQGPSGSYIQSRGRARFRLLVQVRDNFLPEILRSVERL